MKKCTVLQREGCTCAAVHPKGISVESWINRKPNNQRLQRFRR